MNDPNANPNHRNQAIIMVIVSCCSSGPINWDAHRKSGLIWYHEGMLKGISNRLIPVKWEGYGRDHGRLMQIMAAWCRLWPDQLDTNDRNQNGNVLLDFSCHQTELLNEIFLCYDILEHQQGTFDERVQVIVFSPKRKSSLVPGHVVGHLIR